MTRRRRPVTPQEKIADVIQWADRQGLRNIAAELRSALDLLPIEARAAAGRVKRPGAGR
jgi:hypothetical protein